MASQSKLSTLSRELTMEEVEEQLDACESWCREFIEYSYLAVFNRLAWYYYMTAETEEVN